MDILSMFDGPNFKRLWFNYNLTHLKTAAYAANIED